MLDGPREFHSRVTRCELSRKVAAKSSSAIRAGCCVQRNAMDSARLALSKVACSTPRAASAAAFSSKLANRAFTERDLGNPRVAHKAVVDLRSIVVKMNDSMGANYDPYNWTKCGRTMNVAHRHIEANWDKLASGDVVDVEFILGETSAPKESEASYAGA